MPIMAGNVVTPEQVHELSLIGVDIVKVGIGPGSVCTTRKLTGIGYPQFSAVLECADVHSVCADGGITCPGDVAKAFGAGADFVMVGGLFAGHEEGLPPGHKDKIEVPFYGMASKAAQDLHNGGVSDYRASEGKEVMLKYKGPVDHTVNEMLGGLRSACTYLGARNLMELSDNARFVRVNRQLNNIFGNG
jgi:GMP reductase